MSVSRLARGESETESMDRGRALSVEELLAPVGLERFLAEHWGSRELVLRRSRPGLYRGLFGAGDVDRVLAQAARSGDADLSLIRDGRVTRRLRAKSADLAAIYVEVDDGSTLLIERVDRSWAPVRELADRLARALSAAVKVNLYCTPPGRQGAPVHPDIQDVFVLQIEGAKEWHLYRERLYEHVETLRHVDDLGYRRQPIPAEPTPLPPLTLEPGDLLYVPRGMLHRAVAPEDRWSLHLTVCVTPVYWVDFLAVALEEASLSCPELAEALPPGFEWGTGAEAGERTFAALWRLLGERASYAAACRAFARARERREANPADGHFAHLMAFDRIDDGTRLERRGDGPMTIESAGDRVVLRRGPFRIEGPAGLLPVFELIRDRPSFQVGDLPASLGERSRSTLARRLVRAGLMRPIPAE